MNPLHATIEEFAADGYTHYCHCPRCRAIQGVSEGLVAVSRPLREYIFAGISARPSLIASRINPRRQHSERIPEWGKKPRGDGGLHHVRGFFRSILRGTKMGREASHHSKF
jgi:hypothetical protein